MSLNDIPEKIWIEMILSDLGFEIHVPKDKKTDKIKAAYEFKKGRFPMRVREYDESELSSDVGWTKEFSNILAKMNKNGSSEEHNHWRRMAIAAIKSGQY